MVRFTNVVNRSLLFAMCSLSSEAWKVGKMLSWPSISRVYVDDLGFALITV